MFIYRQTEPTLWTVGHYTPNGNWEPESDHESPELAADRTTFLNGGVPNALKELARQNALYYEFTGKIVSALIDYRQSKEPIDISLDDWQPWCFEGFYKYNTGAWIFSRISEGLTEMVNDKDYQVSETELFTI